jgi:hypothetical protein
MRGWNLLIALVLMSAVGTGPALAQQNREQKGPPGKQQGMSKDERQRMREDMREVNRDRGGDRNRQAQPRQQLSPQEREKLRRDIQDANRDLRR